MAEQEIKYIPYGLNEISQLDLMTNMANGLQSFMDKYKWLLKPKYREKFLLAYDDIVKNLVGASDSTGRWTLDVNNIDTEGMYPIDKEIYEHAAHYIQLLMSLMPLRVKELEEKKKEDLDTFDFYKGFNNHLLNTYYGGNSTLFADPELGWNSLDVRDSKTGLRGTDKRREKMIEALESYKRGLEGKDFNFEGTPFTDINDANTKILAAIDALRNTPKDTSDDLPAFNALGLTYRSYFSNGGNDASTHLDANGNPYTYNLWNEYLSKLQLDKIKAELAKVNALIANQYGSYRFFGHNLAGKPLSPEKANLLYLQGLAAKDNLTGDELSELVGVFKLAAKNNALLNLSKEELQRFGAGYANNPGRLKKLPELLGLYWDTIGNRIIKPYSRDSLPQTNFLNILDLNNPELLKLKLLSTPISKEGWNSADTADVVSMIGDLVSLGGFWANVGGTATSLTSDLYADITRGKDLGDILKGIGVNLGWGLAGMLPGAKSTKLAARAARLVPKAFMLAQSAGIVMDPEVLKSALKFTKPSEYKNITAKDLENLKYLFHAVSGGTNIAKSHYRAKQYRETLNKLEVQTKNGTKSLSNKLIKDINKAGRKEGQKAAENKFKEYTGLEAAEGQFKFSENGLSKYNPARYSSILSKFSSDNKLLEGKQVVDGEALNNLLQEDKARSGYHWNKGYPRFELTPFKNMFRKDFDKSKLISSASGEESPYAKKPLEQGKVKATNHIEGLPDKSNAKEISFNRETMNEYKKVMEGKFSNKKMIDEKNVQIGNEKVTVYTTKDDKGKSQVFSVATTSKGNHNFKTLEEAKKFIADIVKQLKNNITSGKITKQNVKEIGKVLLDLKRKGWLKQGGQINSLDKIIEDFINNNNI